jgi:hypothetical protein
MLHHRAYDLRRRRSRHALEGQRTYFFPSFLSSPFSLADSSSPQWTAATKDGQNSAQFEETLLVTETGIEVLTARPGWALPAEGVQGWRATYAPGAGKKKRNKKKKAKKSKAAGEGEGMDGGENDDGEEDGGEDEP